MLATCDEKAKMFHISFDGVDDLMSYTMKFKKPDCPEILKEEAERFSEIFTQRNHWNGRKNADCVAKDLLSPTPETAEALATGEALFDSEDWATEKPKRKLKRRLEDGDEIDIDRWREREPDMWEETKKVKGPRFGVRIGVNVATSAHVGKEGFKWRTSAVIAMLRMVEDLNIPCEVVCYEQTLRFASYRGESGETYTMGLMVEFPAKRADHLLDVDLLAYVLGDQSFFRVGILGGEVMAMKEKWGERLYIDSGLGSPREWSGAAANEFILSRACLTKEIAEKEVRRFKEWLIAIRNKANYGIDERDDAAREARENGNPFAGL